MKSKEILFFLVLFVLSGCYNKKTDITFNSLCKVCDELNLEECSVVFEQSYDSKKGKKNEIVININFSSNTKKYYVDNFKGLFGKIAYEVSMESWKKNDNEIGSEIKVIGNINGEIHTTAFSQNQLYLCEKRITIAHCFLFAAAKHDLQSLKKITSEEYISDSTLISMLDGIDYMSKCGKIENVDLLGLYFDTVEKTSEEVTVLDLYIKRSQSEEQFTFYVLNQTNQIIFINMKSSMNCN